MSDLLGQLQDNAPTTDEVEDLLGGMNDEGSPAWVPEDAGEGIQGTLRAVSDQADQYGTDEDRVPVWTIELQGGDKVRVLGFGSVLRREMNESGAEPGDTVAVKYYGEKTILKGKWAGKNYKHFGVAVRKGR